MVRHFRTHALTALEGVGRVVDEVQGVTVEGGLLVCVLGGLLDTVFASMCRGNRPSSGGLDMGGCVSMSDSFNRSLWSVLRANRTCPTGRRDSQHGLHNSSQKEIDQDKKTHNETLKFEVVSL
jgi:hypothetical protein